VGGWATPRPGRFIPEHRAGTPFTLGWAGPRACLKGRGKSALPPEFDLWTFYPVASHYSELALPAQCVYAVLCEAEVFVLVNDSSTYQTVGPVAQSV
jgi:hypothetical protein